MSEPREIEKVAIVGVGLIGASIGLALRRHGRAEQVVGIGRRASSLQAARRIGAVDSGTVDLAEGVAEAGLVVVCSPVGKIVGHVRQAARYAPEGTVITDTGSTKGQIVRALARGLPRGCRFVGGHPLAGSEKSGPEHADPALFEGRLVILTPTRTTAPGDCTRVERFWLGLGARVVRMSPAAHDRALALTSHLPHAVAVALAGILPARYRELTATGFRDTSRLASGSPELWGQVFAANRRHVTAALARFEKSVAELRSAIEDDDPRRLERILIRAKKNRDALGS